MNRVIQEVTERIIERSKETRAAYLAKIERPFREAASHIEAVVKDIDYWSTIEMDVPTNNLRTSARRDA